MVRTQTPSRRDGDVDARVWRGSETWDGGADGGGARGERVEGRSSLFNNPAPSKRLSIDKDYTFRIILIFLNVLPDRLDVILHR